MIKRSSLAIIFWCILGFAPVSAQDAYKQLEMIASGKGGDNLYLFQVATNKCWKIDYTQTAGDVMRFDVKDHSGDLLVNKRSGSADVPWRWKIEKRYLSSAERVVNRCLPSEVRRPFSSGNVSRLENGVPYLWTFKAANSFCARMAVYTTCATDCRLTVPRNSEVYGIALTKGFAEKVSKATCLE